MRDYIATNGNEEVVAKFRTANHPTVPNGFNLEEVESVDDFKIEESVRWFP